MQKTTMPDRGFWRRIASGSVTLDGNVLGLYVVETDSDGAVLDYYPLVGELPFTEWVAEPVALVTDADGKVRVK